MLNNNETVSLRTAIFSILTIAGIAIAIYAVLSKYCFSLNPNPLMMFPPLISSAGFIWVFGQPITKMYKTIFKEK